MTQTSLMIAAMNNALPILGLLLDAGAAIASKDVDEAVSFRCTLLLLD